MKKLVALAMILAVAVPSMAAVSVNCAQVGTTPAFTISYSYTSPGSFPRAFALDVTTSLGTISGVTATKTGESTSASKGFGIFPGTIVINTATGVVTSVGSPVAPSDDPGALGGLGTAGVTLELGSLYAAGGQPLASNTLVTVALSGVAAGQTATVSIVPNATRGGIVLEDATSDGTANGCTVGLVIPPPTACFSNALSTYARWTLSGSPACWCPPTSVTGAPVGGTGYQCVGDSAQDTTGTLRVYTSDLNLVTSNWKRTLATPGYNPCADVAHDTTGTLAVYTSDLNRVTSNWKKTNAQLNTILGVGGTGGYCGSATVPPAFK